MIMLLSIALLICGICILSLWEDMKNVRRLIVMIFSYIHNTSNLSVKDLDKLAQKYADEDFDLFEGKERQ